MRLLSVILILALLPGISIAEIRIEGVSGVVEQNVRAFVDLDRETCASPRWRVERRYRRLHRQTREALEPFGYYSPSVESTLSFDEDCWTATLEVEPGPQVKLRSVEIEIGGEAQDDEAFLGGTRREGLEPGAALSHEAYESFKSSLQVQAAERGYVDASFTTARLDIWPEELAADVTLAFDSGDRYAIGEVSIEQDILEQSLVERYLRLDSGTPYDSQQLADAYRALTNSGYFQTIQITPMFDDAADERIPLSVVLTPAKRIEYTVGAGYATDSGVRLRGDYRNRRVNDRGHRLDVSLSLSELISGLGAEYRMPLGNPRTEWMSYTAAIEHEDTDTSESDQFRTGARRTTEIGRNWLQTASIDFFYDRFTVGTTEDTSRLVLPAIAFDSKQSDRDLYPTRGRRLGLELRGTHEALGSTTSFVQLIARARIVRTIGGSSRLIGRLNAGVTVKDEFNQLPPTFRFFAGGDESIRGYGYETLGPTDSEGNVIGGSNLLLASVEVEKRIRRNWYGAVFVDAGNAFDALDVDPAIGVGLGIKWRSPAGPLRFYVAHPLNQSDDDVRLHISLGADL